MSPFSRNFGFLWCLNWPPCVVSGTQTLSRAPSRTRTITISSTTWPSVDLDSPSWLQISIGPYKQLMIQLSVQMLYLQLGETWLCTIALLAFFLSLVYEPSRESHAREPSPKLEEAAGPWYKLEELNLADKTGNYIAAWKTIHSLCSGKNAGRVRITCQERGQFKLYLSRD